MIRANHLQLKMGGRILVEDLDLHIEAGQYWCVIGRNGAGKSTLLRTLAGLHEPDSGNVELKGRALADWSPEGLACERAFLPQSRSDAFGYRAIEIVLAARHPYRADQYWEGSDDHEAAHAALCAMEIAGLAERDVRTLSGGERQRVAIAALLAQDTPLLLLDEPANALDLAHQVSVMRLLARLCREQGKTVAMVGHDLNLAHGVASHALLLMGDGRWQGGTVEQVMQPDILGSFLGHRIETIQHGTRTIFIAAEETGKSETTIK